MWPFKILHPFFLWVWRWIFRSEIGVIWWVTGQFPSFLKEIADSYEHQQLQDVDRLRTDISRLEKNVKLMQEERDKLIEELTDALNEIQQLPLGEGSDKYTWCSRIVGLPGQILTWSSPAKTEPENTRSREVLVCLTTAVSKLKTYLQRVKMEKHLVDKDLSEARAEHADLRVQKERDGRKELSAAKAEANCLRRNVSRLETDLKRMQEERDENMRRLSEIMSSRLRDNNPNIADLDDQFRPTKLADIFSEIYDNEWTAAFELLEASRGEKEVIALLLDVVMEAHTFCVALVQKQWDVVHEEVLWDMDGGRAADTLKWLKDARKSHARTMFARVHAKFEQNLQEMSVFNTDDFKKEDVKKYIQSCIHLCWLMSVQDPPVVFECPGWFGSKYDTQSQTEEAIVPTGPPGVDDTSLPAHNDQVTDIQQPEQTAEDSPPQDALDKKDETKVAVEVEDHAGDVEQALHSQIQQNTQDLPTQGTHMIVNEATAPEDSPAEPSKVIENHTNVSENLQGQTDNKREFGETRSTTMMFDRDVFREYTSKGRVVEFVVWPAMYLCKNGAILRKGVAQGFDG